MKILVVSINYFPEPARITDICEELVKRGHEVTVITEVPNCPKGDFYDGYPDGRARDEVINGVKVHRCFTIARKIKNKRRRGYGTNPLCASERSESNFQFRTT